MTDVVIIGQHNVSREITEMNIITNSCGRRQARDMRETEETAWCEGTGHKGRGHGRRDTE